jgi:hypothetical protein
MLGSVLSRRAAGGFQSQAGTDQAVSPMKQTKVYPLDKASSPPAMQLLNDSKQGHRYDLPK